MEKKQEKWKCDVLLIFYMKLWYTNTTLRFRYLISKNKHEILRYYEFKVIIIPQYNVFFFISEI